MPVLIAAVVIVGILCVLNLLLQPAIDLASGQMPASFAAPTNDGTEVTGPGGLRLTGFFASWCSVCPERMVPFVEFVRARQNRPAALS
jgi:hypothetical protein